MPAQVRDRAAARRIGRWSALALVLGAAWLVLRSRADGTAPVGAAPSADATAAAGTPATALDRERVPAAEDAGLLAGTIATADGAPIAAALLTAVPQPPAPSVRGSSGADGAFALHGLPREPLRLLVQHPDFLAANLAVPATRAPLRIALQRPPGIVGRVTFAATGAPATRFAIALLPRDDDAPTRAAALPPATPWLTAADGSFRLTAERAGPHTLIVAAEGCPLTQRRLDLTADRTERVAVALEVGVSLRGFVRTVDDRPVAVALVVCERADPSASAHALTDADGAFALAALPPGDYALRVLPEDQPSLSTTASLSTNAPRPSVTLRLPTPASASGRVTPWAAGRRATVVLQHESGPVRRAPVDPATGTWSIGGLTPGRHALGVLRDEPSWRARVAEQLLDVDPAARIELAAGANPGIDVADPIAQMARLRGRVLGGHANSSMLVTAARHDAPLPERCTGLFRARVQPDGAFELDGFLPGNWLLEFTENGRLLRREPIAITAGADLERTFAVPGPR